MSDELYQKAHGEGTDTSTEAVSTQSEVVLPNEELEVPVPAGDDSYYVASQWKLMWWKFRKHKLAVAASVVVGIFYFIAVFCQFLAPYEKNQRHTDFIYAPPQRVRIFHEGSLRRPFVYGYTKEVDMETLQRIYVPDPEQVYPIRLFVRGNEYEFWGLFDTDLHFIGVTEEGGTMFLLGTDRMGRDMLSRILVGTQISVSIGLLGVLASFFLGLLFGGLSGYYGGAVDMVIQRIIEVLRSFPTIPLWLALSAALPTDWPVLRVYFFITLILSLRGWIGLARVVRGKILSLREEDFSTAALVAGSGETRIIFKHLLPSFMSHIIVSITVAIPSMILGETALSFLGLGLRPPVVSWGVLLQSAQNVQVVALYPWLMLPVAAVIIFVLAFNFVGDGLRDAADPYSR